MKTFLERYNEAFQGIEDLKIASDIYVVAYIDLLGITKTMMDNNDRFLVDLKKLYVKLIRHTNQEDNCFGFKDVSIKIFSDNIVIVQKIKSIGNYEAELLNVINLCSIFQFHALIDCGLLLRGGISIGDLYIDDDFTIGKGLITAYKLENEIANYPRIILDKNILKNIDIQKIKMPYGIKKILMDFDGEYYINYLSYYNKIALPTSVLAITEYFNTIKLTEKDKKILQKYNWQLSYLDIINQWVINNLTIDDNN